jgi:hypothetical protein
VTGSGLIRFVHGDRSGPRFLPWIPPFGQLAHYPKAYGAIARKLAAAMPSVCTMARFTSAISVGCRENGIEHWLTKIGHPWKDGQLERMNRMIKEVTVKRYRHNGHRRL